jgi:lipopolysaccharide/colanic/teichoic acid biosynthesis glycosyltransferase
MINFFNPLLDFHNKHWRPVSALPCRSTRIKRWLQDLSWSIGSLNYGIMKRWLDVVTALAVLIILAPLLILISILVKLDDGPAFFSQTRVGRYGRTFRMLKFRSMRVDAEDQLAALLARNTKAEGITFKLDHDPRITKVGAILRRFSLDELPQFINVLMGHMSVVGPRPALPREVERYTESDRMRLLAKPGLTCLWQVGERQGGFWEVGDRNKIDFSEQVALDVRYLSHPSLLLDLRIMFKTVPAMFLGK